MKIAILSIRLMNSFAITIGLLLVVSNIHASVTNKATSEVQVSSGNDKAKNALYIEILGNGGFFSVNYERQLFTAQVLRAGIGIVNGVTAPFLYNFVIGNEVHKLEIGAGVTFLQTFSSRSSRGLVPTGNLSYRWHYSSENVNDFIRISFTPFFGAFSDYGNATAASWEFVPWGGVSFGAQF